MFAELGSTVKEKQYFGARIGTAALSLYAHMNTQTLACTGTQTYGGNRGNAQEMKVS